MSSDLEQETPMSHVGLSEPETVFDTSESDEKGAKKDEPRVSDPETIFANHSVGTESGNIYAKNFSQYETT